MKLNLKFPPTPENAPKLSELIVESAQRISKKKLDYSPDSLKTVDGIIEGFRTEKLKIENIIETLFCFGCYVGEVFIRNTGGLWKWTTEIPVEIFSNEPLLLQTPNSGIANPIGKVMKRFQNGDVDSLSYFYHMFVDRSK
jgi:hypothetical protein